MRKESRRDALVARRRGEGAIRLGVALSGAVEKRTSAGVRGQKLQGGAVIMETAAGLS